MHSRLRLVVVWSLLLGTAVVVGVTGATVAQSDGLAQTQPDGFDATVFEITVLENGDARWTVQHSRPLEDESDVDQFESFAQRFRTEELDAYQNFQVRAQRLTEQGTETTGRQMDATDFSRDAYVDELGQRRGVISMSFRWTNFAPVQNETVVVGDLFSGGFAITDGQRLRIRPGDGLAFASPDAVAPEPDSMTHDRLVDSSSVTWFGERQFADNRPRAELVPASQVGADDGTDGTTDDGTDGTTDDGTDGTTVEDGTAGVDGTDQTSDGDGDSASMWPVAVMGLLVLVGIGGGLAWYTTRTPRPTGQEGEGAGSTVEPETTASPPAPPEEELLSDEDRVISLLEENDGRMKQVDIVDQTDWSKSKVSMLLSEMEEDGQITKLRVGRENIISLAGNEPDAVGSPFDDE